MLHGKLFGFSLREISEYLSLYEVDPTHNTQRSRLLELVDKRLDLLTQQMSDLETTLTELKHIKEQATAQLYKKGA